MGIVPVEEARQHIGDERGGEGGVDEAGEREGRSAHRATSEPLARDRVAAPIGMPDNEGIGARHASRFEDLRERSCTST